MLLDLNLTPHTKINSKRIIGVNARHKSVKLLGKKINRIKSSELRASQSSYIDFKNTLHRNSDKFDLICPVKDPC